MVGRGDPRGRPRNAIGPALGVTALAGALVVSVGYLALRPDEPASPIPVVVVESPRAQAAPEPAAQRPAFVVLRHGMRGTGVEQVQRTLHDLGYQVRAVDGVFDDETLHAVVAFQKANGLESTGVLDEVTHEVLARPASPRPRSATPGTHVEVDLARQLLYVVRDGVIDRIYDASTGRDTPTTRTPLGEFRVEYQIDGWRYARLGPMYRPSYINDTGIAIHGGEPVESRPASNGCIRITDPSVDAIFDLLRPGTRVLVY